jgi:hypothetical protein
MLITHTPTYILAPIYKEMNMINYSVADLDPGSGTGFFQIPDLVSRIPNLYF